MSTQDPQSLDIAPTLYPDCTVLPQLLSMASVNGHGHPQIQPPQRVLNHQNPATISVITPAVIIHDYRYSVP